MALELNFEIAEGLRAKLDGAVADHYAKVREETEQEERQEVRQERISAGKENGRTPSLNKNN
jgi:hypothetical protein